MGWVKDAESIDVALYAAVAQTPTPSLDRAMRRLSRAADRSKLNAAGAAVIATVGGAKGRSAAREGLASIGVASAVVNVLVKPLARRRRPDRETDRVPFARHVAMPKSRSFPSGHAASAFAFATAAGNAWPPCAAPLRLLAAAVGYSRVHTGVHYPGDVVAGALLGTVIGQATARALDL